MIIILFICFRHETTKYILSILLAADMFSIVNVYVYHLTCNCVVHIKITVLIVCVTSVVLSLYL